MRPFSSTPLREIANHAGCCFAIFAEVNSKSLERSFRGEIVEMKTLSWFGIHVKSHSEFRAYEDLRYRGFEAFLPVAPVRRRWSDRVKKLNLPLFPGYLFCRFAIRDRFTILNAAGVVQIVGTGAAPVAICDREIQSIRTLVDSKIAVTPWPYLKIGQLVRIDDGPLAGVEGIILQAEDGKPRIIVSVTMFMRSIAVEIERGWICSVRNADDRFLISGAA